MKIFIRNIHLWLSLIAGVIFFIECLSGALLVFEEEITEALYAERYYVQPKEEQLGLSVDSLVVLAQSQIAAQEEVKSVKVYGDHRRTVELTLGKKLAEDKKSAKNVEASKAPKKGGRERGRLAFINPYTGNITAIINPAEPTFFSTMLKIHQSLLGGDIGKSILGVSTFIVFIILISGLVLWFPKSRKQLKARLQLKTQASWKRLNHDLHVVLGFYCTIFLIIFLVTSLPWSFKWANSALYTLTNSKPGLAEKPKSAIGDPENIQVSYQNLLQIGQQILPEAPYWSLNLQVKKADEPASISAANTVSYHRNGFDQISVDRYTGKVMQVDYHQDTPAGWQIRRYMKPVHTGAIAGIPTKIIACVVCLISASFPITGLILWINRLRKKKSKKKSKLVLN